MVRLVVRCVVACMCDCFRATVGVGCVVVVVCCLLYVRVVSCVLCGVCCVLLNFCGVECDHRSCLLVCRVLRFVCWSFVFVVDCC